jgi:hypothetical protein
MSPLLSRCPRIYYVSPLETTKQRDYVPERRERSRCHVRTISIAPKHGQVQIADKYRSGESRRCMQNLRQGCGAPRSRQPLRAAHARSSIIGRAVLLLPNTEATRGIRLTRSTENCPHHGQIISSDHQPGMCGEI